MNIAQQIRQFWRDGELNRLASRDHTPKTSWERIGWWEARRVPWNLIVGCAGLVTCTSVFIYAIAADILFGKDIGLPDPPIFGVFMVLFYAIGANVCYTGGWICELLVAKLWPQEADQFARRSFAAGLIFSVFVTLIPGVLMLVMGILGLIKHYRLVQ